MADWKTIDTAPKDGTPVDLWDPAWNERCVNYFREDLGNGNVFYSPCQGGRCVVRTATHWMPLPSPPEIAAAPKLAGEEP